LARKFNRLAGSNFSAHPYRPWHLAAGTKKYIKRNHESWNSYELLIGEDFVARRLKDLPEVEIQRHEITKIRETSAGLRVETNQKDRAIGIAPSLVGYDDAKERLSRWMMPVRESRQQWFTPTRWAGIVPVLVLLLFGCIYLGERSWFIIATGLPLLIGLSVSILRIRKSVQASAQMKRLSLITILPLLAVAARLIQAILNWR